MATGQQAIQRIAEVTGRSEPSVYRAARDLREAGGDLWPTSKRGPQKNPIHVQAHHLSNLAIALATPDQNVRAQSVREYRAMSFVNGCLNPRFLLGERFEDLSAFEQCPTFGEAIDFLITHLDNFDLTPSEPEHSYGRIKILLSNTKMASIGREWRGPEMKFPDYPEMAWVVPTGRGNPNDIAIEIQATIRNPMLQALADLLPAQDNQQEQSPSPSGPASTTADTGNENAALPQAAPRRARKRVAATDGPRRPVATLPLLEREKQHTVLGHPQMGILPAGVTKHEHPPHPSPA